MSRTKAREIVLGIAVAAFILSAASAVLAKSPKPKTVKGAGAGSFGTIDFSYDGAEPGSVSILTGADSNGAFNGQIYAEYVSADTTCTAPDKTAGEEYTLVGEWSVLTYTKGDALLVAGSKDGSECVSKTTGVFGGSLSYVITGGSGKYTGASGIGTLNFGGVVLFFGDGGPGYGLVGTIVGEFSEQLTLP